MVPIVQLAERLTVDQKDVGSRPTGHPKRWPKGHFFFILLLLLSGCRGNAPSPVTASPAPMVAVTTTLVAPAPSPSPIASATSTPSPLERLRIVYGAASGLWLWENGASRPLTFEPGDADPGFSPDGLWITFRRGEALWVIGPDGEARSLITPDYLGLLAPGKPIRLAQPFAWMPGTANLFFTTQQATVDGWRPRFDLHVVDARFGQPILVLEAGRGGIPFFSPRGNWLALVREGEIALTSPNPLKPRNVFTYQSIPGYLPDLHWLPDESGFVLLIPPRPDQATPTPEPSSEYPGLLPTRWWGISIEGKARLLGEFQAEKFSLARPLISPNGDQLLYLYPYRKRGQHELHILDVAGNDAFYTSYYYGRIGPVAWLPNETHFVYWADSPQSLWLAHYGEPARPLVTDFGLDALLLANEDFFLFRHGDTIYLQTWQGERNLLVQGTNESVAVFYGR